MGRVEGVKPLCSMGPKRKAATDPAERDPRDGMVLLHRSSFIEWQPTPIVALASSRDGSMTAAARENGDLELYETSTSHLFHVSSVLYNY